MTATKEKLALEIDVARWQWLKPYHERDSLFVVAQDLELAEVGDRLSADDAATVRRWLASHLLAKPTPQQLAEWDREPAKGFSMLIVSPFILIQERNAADF